MIETVALPGKEFNEVYDRVRSWLNDGSAQGRTLSTLECSLIVNRFVAPSDSLQRSPLWNPRNSFLSGPAGVIFGRWNRLCAFLPSLQQIAFIGAHGGEFVPGDVAEHLSSLRERTVNKIVRPVQLDIDITMACASACTFCFSASYRSARTAGRHMARDAIFDVIQQAHELGVRVVRFDGGGDPTSSPYLSDAITLCRSLGISTALLTAGDTLHETLFEPLVAAGTYVRVSLNAASDEVRNLLHRTPARGGFRLSQIMQNISDLNDLRRSRYPQPVQASMLMGGTFMIHPLNVHEVYDLARKAKESGLDHVSYRVVLGRDHVVAFTDSQLRMFAEDRERIRVDLCDDGFQVFLPSRNLSDEGYVPAEHFNECRASTHRILVEVGATPNAPALVPCGRYRGRGYNSGVSNDDTRDDVVFAHLTEENGLSSTWMGPRMQRVLARFPEACGDCIDRSANVSFEAIEHLYGLDPRAEMLCFHEENNVM